MPVDLLIFREAAFRLLREDEVAVEGDFKHAPAGREDFQRGDLRLIASE